MSKQKISAKQSFLRMPRLVLALCGLLLVAMLAPTGQASAAGPRWEIAQGFPAQVFPESVFFYSMQLVNVGTAPAGEDLQIHVQAPPGLRLLGGGGTFNEKNLGFTFPCTVSGDHSALDCSLPAQGPLGQPGAAVGRSYAVQAQVQVETGAPNGPGRFHVEFNGGPGAAPPPPIDSRPTEITSTEEPFGIAEVDSVNLNEDGSEATQAGGHPWASSTTIRFTTKTADDPGGSEVVPTEIAKDITVDLPAGYLGNPEATPKCSPDQLNVPADFSLLGFIPTANCPADSQVGTALLDFGRVGLMRLPVFNIEPRSNAVAEFGFNVVGKVVRLFPEVRPNDNGIRVRFRNIDHTLKLYGSTVTLWGSPPDRSHDALRRFCGGTALFGTDGAGCPLQSSIPPVGFYVAPTSCLGPLTTSFAVTGWAGGTDTAQFTSRDNNGNPQGMTGCDRVPFDPTMAVNQTADTAETPSGIDFKLSVPEEGILNPTGVSQAHLRKAVVELPEGVTLNPSSAEGLGTCSPAQYEAETLLSDFGAGCPGSSKLGSLQISSPALPESEVLKGDLFIASPYDNPSGSLIAVYLVARSIEKGIIVKAAGKVEPDPRTGQIVTTFDNLPQLPFADFELHFREGGRAPLTTPSTCGTHTTEAALTPWSAKENPAPSEIAHLQSSYQITRGVGGGPCPSAGVPPFDPDFEAGSINNNAKSYTPFNMRLTRQDGEQNMTKFSSTLPPGVLGKLAGVGKCAEAAIAAAKARSGTEELASPSCPANSQIGRVLAGAGVGSVLTYVKGSLYLGGPYNGAPLSVVVITPAVAGPFDVGTVVTREALTLNPETAEVEVDGAASDPIPHILEGIPLKLRDLRVYVDREKFILNPTSCDPSSVKATLFGSFLDVFSPADDVPVSLEDRFQAANCLNLGFKPKLALNLKGGTKRGDLPAFKATLKARPGDANIARAQVTLPRSAFLEQAHLNNICTRVQFRAEECPKGSIYGTAKAITPLLDEPIEGPVVLRSSNHKLPDLVIALKGLVDVNVVSRIDSHKGGLRSTFESVPDAPVSRFVLKMKGGKKGLIVNSRNLCADKNRAKVAFTGQNGRAANLRPELKPQCGKVRKRR